MDVVLPDRTGRPVRVLICGSRDWDKPIPIDVVVGGLASVYGHHNVTIVEGDARGADGMAGSAAERHGVALIVEPAKWDTHDREGSTPVRCRCAPGAVRCKAAGVRRNQRMLDEHHPEVVFAFTDDLTESRGTADMVRRARAAGLPVYVIGRA